MVVYFLRRLGFLALIFLVTSLIVFLVTQYLPGDVCRIILGREAGEAALEMCRENLGLNNPLIVQYTNWLGDFLTGDWGISYSTKMPVFPLVMGRFRNSMMLMTLTLCFAVPISVLLGILAGLNENRWTDHLINVFSLSVVGLPEFVTGLVLIAIFSFRLEWLPANSSIPPEATFREALPMLILPALTASLVLLAYIARLTRAGVIAEMEQPYVRTATLKGLPQRIVIVKHVLRNALLPTITVVAISIGWLISGMIIIENVYNYPGLGRLLVFAIDRRDLPVLQAVTLVTVLVFALANLAADLLYAGLTPRIRLK